ncbi:MAG: hypothetical protein QF460_00020 [Candidatus Nanoarchaeia archaeon]|mgnify:CR=1 FL=1|jgi:hypothetical protein|nr:hypothetical protein [Candidatus Nanoarchaeia archaeon]|tara:strand:+ start:1142 stop:2110 length:969 start_codon:yes stop_codon:yes gene_type:complete
MNIQKLVFVVLLIFVSGCIHGAQTQSDSFGGGLIGEDKGIIFEISDLPPAISSNQAFELEVSATNAGSYSVNPEEVRVSLSNSKSFDFSLTEDFQQIVSGENGLINNNVILKSLDADVLGGSTLFLFRDMSYITKPSQDVQIPLTVDTCYYYNTVASVNICVAKDTSSEICSSSEAKPVVNQGAPVKVSGFSQISSLGNSNIITSNIRIDVSAVGDGKFESYSTPKPTLSCTALASDIILNSVRLRAIRVGSHEIDGDEIDSVCGTDIIMLDTEGKGSVNCNGVTLYSQYSESIGDFEERMVITLDYLNSDSVTENLNVLAL